jgi:hypothetical protein
MEEGLREMQPLVGRRWRAVKFEDVVNAAEALIWLSPEAFRYFIPDRERSVWGRYVARSARNSSHDLDTHTCCARGYSRI